VNLYCGDVIMDSSTFMFQVIFPTRDMNKEKTEHNTQLPTKKSRKERLNHIRKESVVSLINEINTRKRSNAAKKVSLNGGVKEPVETSVRRVIDKYVKNPLLFETTENKAYASLRFCIASSYVEQVLCELQSIGIGRVPGSSMSVLPLSIHYSPSSEIEKKETKERLDKFYASIKSRLIVAEVVARIRSGAQFSFDFLLLLLLASVIAFVGLVENSSVVLVASMLVSPLMGPLLAGIFGAVIEDKRLAMNGVKHETQALLICILVGFLLGLCVCPVVQMLALPEWPTPEMISRGAPRSLVVGVLVAIPSGAGVALSVLGGNSGSLVGVAISASLLPPAVNAGFFWALAIVLAIGGEKSMAGFYAMPGHNETILAYLPHYSSNLAVESLVLGLVSLALTLVNIICIIVIGFGILRLKEVTPEKIPQRFSNFWRKDIREHRHQLRTLGGKTPTATKVRDTIGDGLDGTFMQSMFDRVSRDEDLLNIRQWVYIPRTAVPDNHSSLDNSNTLLEVTGSPILGMAAPSIIVGSDTTYLSIPQFIQQEITRSRSFCDKEIEQMVQT